MHFDVKTTNLTLTGFFQPLIPVIKKEECVNSEEYKCFKSSFIITIIIIIIAYIIIIIIISTIINLSCCKALYS